MGTNVPPRTEITTEERLAEVMADVEKRVANDDLVFVGFRGELDYLTNSKKEDMIVVTGMTSTIAKPSDQIEARKWIRGTLDQTVPRLHTDSICKSKP